MQKLLLAGLLSALFSVAHATTMIAMDVDHQADESHAFVDAVVGESEVVVTERMVYTHTEIVVSSVVAGEAPKRFTLRTAGGVLPERTVAVPGNAKLEKGDRILAFVRGRDGLWYFTALGQSVWHVEDDGTLTQDLHLGGFMERDYTGRVVPATQSFIPYESYTELVTDVSELDFGGAL